MMSHDNDLHQRFQIGPFLSASGSVASLAALVVVLIDKGSASAEIDAQQFVWRMALALMSLAAIGATIVITYDHVRSVFSTNIFRMRAKTIRAFVAISLGILGSAVFLDALFAALYWRWWLGEIFNFLRRLF